MMDSNTLGIQSKMTKLECSLYNLNLEILTTINFLQCLKENAASVVKNLNNITTPVAYLHEYLNVNSFIMKYLSFLNEMNCKLEILGINSGSSNITVQNTTLTPVLQCKKNEKSEKDSESNQVLENIYINSIESPNLIVGKTTQTKLKRNMSKGSEQVESSKNNNGKDVTKLVTFTGASVSVNDNSKKNDSKANMVVKIDNGNNSNEIKTIEENNSGTKTKPSTSSNKKNFDLKGHAQLLFPHETHDSKSTSEKLSKSEICLTQKKQDMSKKNYHSDVSSFSSVNFPETVVFDKVLISGHQSKGDIPLAEITPTKINDNQSNLEISKTKFSTQSLKNDLLKTVQLNKTSGNEVDTDIKPAEMVRNLGREYDVVIEHIKSPSEFYVSVTEVHSTLLSELERVLKSIPFNKNNVGVKKRENKKSWISKKIGSYALVYSKCDETWLRAKITSWGSDLNDDVVHVFLIDCGECKCVSVDDLLPMPAFVKQYPALTERCHLFGILPVDMDVQNDTFLWEKETVEKMRSLTESSNRIRIKIAPIDSYHPPSSLSVTLWLADKENQCVNELLVKSSHAVLSTSAQSFVPNQTTIKTEALESHVDDNKILSNWNPMKEDFESYQNSYDLDMNDPAAFIYGYVGKDYERVCKLFAKTGYCFKGNACKKEHKYLNPLGFTTDQEEVYQNAFNTLPVPSTDSVLNAQVTYILDFNQFFCIPKNSGLFNEDEDLQSLLKLMNSHENVRTMKKLVIPPSAGQIVIGRYSMDKAWYRARVLESEPENDKYKVWFVDFGNTETLPLSDIRAIEGRYLHLPFQAMQCYIFGIRQNPEVPLKEVMDYIHDILDDDNISIEVIARLPGEHINLSVHVRDHNGRNIADDLVGKGYAILKEELLINPCSESIPG